MSERIIQRDLNDAIYTLPIPSSALIPGTNINNLESQWEMFGEGCGAGEGTREVVRAFATERVPQQVVIKKWYGEGALCLRRISDGSYAN
jgi:hypothetical protein